MIIAITQPDNLDEEHAKRVRSLLDAFADLGEGSLCLHETSIKHLSYIAWAWAQARGHRITVSPMVRCDGDVYESWDFRLRGGSLYVFPKQMGMLSSSSDTDERIRQIQREAQDRIRAVIGGAS